MRTLTIGIALAIALGLTSAAAHAQTWKPPADAQRCPSKWGAGDERGLGQSHEAGERAAATRLIKTGEVIEIAHVLNGKMPFFGTRRFDVHTKRTFMNQLSNRRGSNEELVISEIGQVGTQFDGFAHQSIEYSHYNCFKTDEISTRTGFTKLGIEKVGTLMTRGVLIDVAALQGRGHARRHLRDHASGPAAGAAAPERPAAARRRRPHQHRLGQALGQGQRPLHKSCPGIGVAAAEWLAKQDPMLVGADNWPVEVAPNPDPQLSLPVHQIMLVVNGIHMLENLKLDELAAKQVYEFAFVMQPLKVQGFTGSTVAPVAIR